MGLYTVKRDDKEMKEVTPATFNEIGASERDHLQEWIANTPGCLGEKLLIIAKEFDGFDGTRERSDLLALDEDGRLVVIENKLDDSGRDVVWQAMKYAAYYSTFTTANIIQTSAKLVGNGDEAKAKESITSFLKEVIDREGELRLNPDGKPRVFLVARKFRIEVTATVLWLIKRFDMDIRCHIATPYKHGDEILLRTKQLLPLPEEDEFMIKITQKEAEEKTFSNTDARRHYLRRRFWQKTLDKFRSDGFGLYDNINATRDYWLSKTAGISGVNYQMQFLMRKIAVEFRIASSDKDKNKRIYDALVNHRSDIDGEFPGLTWDRRDDEIMSVIKIEKPTDDSWEDESAWDDRIDWLRANVEKMHSVMEGRLAQVRNEIRD